MKEPITDGWCVIQSTPVPDKDKNGQEENS